MELPANLIAKPSGVLSMSAQHSAKGEVCPPGLCVTERINFHAQSAPYSLAVRCAKASVNYGELNTRAELLAQFLRSLGVGRDVLVGVCLPRSIAFVVCALGIMKAGGAYLPLDPSRPQGRFAFQLADAEAKLLIVSDDFSFRLPNTSTRLIRVSSDGVPIAKMHSDPAVTRIGENDLAYVVYTSGSTGRPKGVEIEHRSLDNLVAWHCDAFQITSADRASQISGIEFDAAVWEIWPYLAAGARVHIADDSVARDSTLLREWLLANGITVSFASSPVAEQLLGLEWPPRSALRILLTGADILHRYPPVHLPFHLVNNYGPTECTVVTTSAVVAPGEDGRRLPPIGRPIRGAEVYILNEHGRVVPPGSEGEICIGGSGLARGYRNNPKLTAEKFVCMPCDGLSNSLVYRTGDIGRVLPDGQLAFLGRSDDQINLRGFRIEPAEIELAINELLGVRESAVVACAFGSGDKRLVAYVVTDTALPPMPAIRSSLAGRLPEFMIPSDFVLLSSIPHASSGKIDREALRKLDPEAQRPVRTAIAPETVTEKQLVAILVTLLETDRVSTEDNFFTLGGHSLLGTQFIARIRDAFGVEISLRFLFESPTIAATAREVDRLLALQRAALDNRIEWHSPRRSRAARGGD